MELSILLVLIATASALDVNRNGVSDVWEAKYPDAAAQPEADFDGDGVRNIDEGKHWTDPGDPSSVLRVEGFHLEGGEARFLFTESRWMRDTVVESENLRTWTRDGIPVAGNSETVAVARPATADRGFYRVVRHDALNSDTDALSNREEEELGTNPELWDTDGDKVSDCQESLNGTDPLSAADSDGDGIPDDWKRWIINHDPNDDVTDFEHVNLTSDFDGDGVPDFVEFQLGTSPVTPIRNVILFLSEDQSIDLGCMGTVGLSTPNVDSFAQSAVLFEKAFCLAPVCSPSKMAMFTGTYPHTNSANRNVTNYGVDFPLVGDPSNLGLGGVHEDLPTLIEILRDRGYFTATSHKSHVQPIRKWPFHKGYGQPTTVAVTQSYINDIVTSSGDRPFYMTFGIGAPHLPFRGILQNQGLWSPTGGLTGDGRATNVDANAIVVPNCYPDVPAVRQDFADYYGAIQCVDTIFGAVMDRLEALGILDETLVIYTSDHGIGLHRAKQSIYTTGTQIPLLIGGAGIQGDIRIQAPVSHLDLVPTILDFVEIPKPPGMAGTSLMPILHGSETTVPGRRTVMASTHDKYDGRAVCDGRYYYVRNIRKISGSEMRAPQLNAQGIDPVLDRGLNTDQYKSGSPWFNRTYDATVAAAGSPGNQLLADLLSGNVPDEELFDLDADPWCVNNLANDPTLASIRTRLAGELSSWRLATEDYNQSPTEMVRRETRHVPLDPPPPPSGGFTLDDSFDTGSGPLDADPSWSLDIAGTSGADFTLGGGLVDAPAGPLTLATRESSELPPGSAFSVSVTTGFQGTGVASGIAFGVVPDGGSHSFWQFMLADGRSSIGGAGKDVRIFRVEQGAQQIPALLSVNSLPDYPTNGARFILTVNGAVGSPLVDLTIRAENGANYYTHSDFDLGAPVPAGSRFGLTSWSSGSSFFDDFHVNFTGPLTWLETFDHSGSLDARPLWTTLAFGNSAADFTFVPDPFGGTDPVLKAAAGPLMLASPDPLKLPAGSAFTVRLKVGFQAAGISGGLVFGLEDASRWFSFELGDGATANAAVQNRLLRIRRSDSGGISNLLNPAAGTLPLVTRDRFYQLSISGTAGSPNINYSITDSVTSAVLASGTHELGTPVATLTRFGVLSNSSAATVFDDLEIIFTPAP